MLYCLLVVQTRKETMRYDLYKAVIMYQCIQVKKKNIYRKILDVIFIKYKVMKQSI